MAHIPGAISIPIEELEEKLASLPSNYDVVAYCRGPCCLMSVEAVELKTKARTLRSVASKAENLMSTKVSDSTSITIILNGYKVTSFLQKSNTNYIGKHYLLSSFRKFLEEQVLLLHFLH